MKILSALDSYPRRWSKLLAIWVDAGSNPAQFSKTMRWMIKKGYVEKTDPADRFSEYKITESGKKYLEGLKA